MQGALVLRCVPNGASPAVPLAQSSLTTHIAPKSPATPSACSCTDQTASLPAVHSATVSAGISLQGQAVNGELGVGDVNSTYLATPAPVAGNLTFTGLALGEKFTCGVADSKAYCWVSTNGLGHGVCCMPCTRKACQQQLHPLAHRTSACRAAASRGAWAPAAMPARVCRLKWLATTPLFP